MGAFFKPWRRKAGCVTLVMACVFAAGWVRSHEAHDEFDFCLSKRNYQCFVSNLSRLTWFRTREEPTNEFGNFRFYSATKSWTRSFLTDGLCTWRWRYCGFEFGESVESPSMAKVFVWSVPYLAIVIPLTLLSAWLFLSKPRPATTKQTTEPAPTTGA